MVATTPRANVAAGAARRPGPARRVRVRTLDGDGWRSAEDQVVTEEPLEIRLGPSGAAHTVTVTMRTPGADFELAAGFLYGEGALRSRGDVAAIRYCTDAEQAYNVVTVDTAPDTAIDVAAVVRALPTSSACGVCGTASLEALRDRVPAPLPAGPTVSAALLATLPGRLREAQRIFDRTGGLHAAGLFTPVGDLVVSREDVGRHNAVDKVVGWALLADRLPPHDHVLVVSGRAGFEIVQKAAVAGIPVVASVSAPSSLAVDLAHDRGLTLAGFVRDGRLTVYSAPERLASG